MALTRKHGGLLWGEHGKGVRSEFSPQLLRPALSDAPGDQGGVRPAQPAQSRQDRRARRRRAAHGRRRADEGPVRPHHPARGPGRLRRGAALQRQRRLLQLGPGRCHVPVLEGHARAAALAQGPGPADAGMAAPARGAGLRPGRGEPPPAPRRRAGAPCRPASATAWPDAAASRTSRTRSRRRMDGCLACKSCVGQCPIKVDVPTFRVEVLRALLRPLPAPARGTTWSARSSTSCR